MKIALLLLLTMLSACATSTPLLSADLVSMTRYSYSGGGLKSVGRVNEQFCYHDTAVYGQNKSIGIMDEVIYKSQKKYRADYIANANFTYVEWTWGRDCVLLEGVAVQKLVHRGGPNSERQPASISSAKARESTGARAGDAAAGGETDPKGWDAPDEDSVQTQ